MPYFVTYQTNKNTVRKMLEGADEKDCRFPDNCHWFYHKTCPEQTDTIYFVYEKEAIAVASGWPNGSITEVELL